MYTRERFNVYYIVRLSPVMGQNHLSTVLLFHRHVNYNALPLAVHDCNFAHQDKGADLSFNVTFRIMSMFSSSVTTFTLLIDSSNDISIKLSPTTCLWLALRYCKTWNLFIQVIYTPDVHLFNCLKSIARMSWLAKCHGFHSYSSKNAYMVRCFL